MTRALILGATGFIGGHVALEALERGWQVRALRRKPASVGLLSESAVEWLTGDLDHPESLAEAFRGSDIVLHAAAYYPHDGLHVPRQTAHAVRQIRNVLEAARLSRVQRLVFTSSLTTIGLPPRDEHRQADERDHYVPGSLPYSAYYETKYAMESEVLRSDVGGVPAVVVNPTAVFGPGAGRGTPGVLLVVAARGYAVVSLPLWTNVVDVRDVAAGHLAAAEVGRSGERYILGGHNIRIGELMRTVAACAGVAGPRFEIPRGVYRRAIQVGRRLPGLSALGNHLAADEYWQPYDCAKAQRELGLSPRPLETTIRDALRWYRDQGILPAERTVV